MDLGPVIVVVRRVCVAVLPVLLALALQAPAASAAFGDDFGIVPGSFWVGTCDLPVVDGSEPVDNTVTPPVSAVAVEKRDCHSSSSLAPQTAVPITQAGAHPDATATFEFKPITTHPSPSPPLVGNFGPYPDGNPKDIVVDLPPGWSGNPEATPKCAASEWVVGFCGVATQVGIVDFRESSQATDATDPSNPLFNRQNPLCTLWAPSATTYPQFSFPDGSVVVASASKGTIQGGPGARCRVPVNNIQPAYGEVASFGFNFHFGINVFAQPIVRTDGDFGVQLRATNIPQSPVVSLLTTTLWGVPGDPSHDPFRFRKGYDQNPGAPSPVLDPGQAWPTSVPVLPLISNPTSCDPSPSARTVTLSTRSWQNPDKWLKYEHVPPAVTGCDQVPFDPDLEVEPTTTVADAPTGLSTRLELPQNDDLPAGLEKNPAGAAAHWSHPDGRGLSSAHLDRAVVTLPEGFSVNPAGAAGLEGCSDSDFGLVQDGNPPRFNNDDPFDGKGAECPLGSKIGTAEVFSPLLPSPAGPGEPNLAGQVVLGMPRSTDPESGEMFRMFVVVRNEARGLLAKIAGSAIADSETGQLTATFDNNPQVAFETLDIDLKGGERGLLATPPTCGSTAWGSELTPWSATVPTGDPGGSPVSDSGAFVTDDRCGAGFAPAMDAGMSNRQAAGSGTFELHFSRSDGDQWLSDVAAELPAGLVASLKGILVCTNAQADAGACPESSRIGSVDAGAGAGTPFFLEKKGDVYLTEGYKEAPYGLAVKVPVEAGPFRGAFALTPIVVRQALRIDRRTAQVTADSDPFPQIWHGIPLRMREVTVTIDRANFMRNPTDCTAKQIGATFASVNGAQASRSEHFQASGCSGLDFKPRLSMRLTGTKGQLRTDGHPGIRAFLSQPGGQANIEATTVRLPSQLALDPDNARGLCGFKESLQDEPACPASSVIGRARAISPLLNRPLEGPIYFAENRRTSSTGNEIRTLPSLVLALRGEIAINLRASTNAVRGKLVTTFPAIPDAPVSSFHLRLKGGGSGVLVVTQNARRRFNLCKRRPGLVEVDMDAHNGDRRDFNARLRTPCGKRSTRGARARQGGAR